MRKIVKYLAFPLAALAIYSGWQVWNTLGNYRAEAELHSSIMEFKPEPADEITNQNVIDLQQKYSDTVGWLSIPGTNIDYPFVQSDDNDFYLRRDLNGDYATAGTLFLDCRCAANFSSQNTIIYGHNMRNGSMFGTLKRFADKGFFDANPQGTIYLPHDTLTLEFFAYLVVKAGDAEIYSAELNLDYVKQNSRNYREIELSERDRFVTLTTCSYEFDNARMMLLAKIFNSMEEK